MPVDPNLEPVPDFSNDLGTLLQWLGEASRYLGDCSRAFPLDVDTNQASQIGGLRWKGTPTPHQMKAAVDYAKDELSPGL